ncbi:MAG: FecR family protein [Spirochaetia bacterium]|nr:FecR family protein [Spirochaetia bacterium]
MRKIVLLALITVLVVSSLAASGTREKDSERLDKEKIDAVLTYIQGEVTINNQPGVEGSTVPLGATVKTGEDSAAEITFGSQNIFRVEAETITTIHIGKDERRIQIQKGSIDAIFERLGVFADNDRFRVETPSVVAGIRGTVFYINVEKQETTYLCTCHGTVHQEAAEDSVEKDVTAYHHKAYRYIKTDSGVKVESGTLVYHDDESMQSLGNKIDVKIPWGRPAE